MLLPHSMAVAPAPLRPPQAAFHTGPLFDRPVQRVELVMPIVLPTAPVRVVAAGTLVAFAATAAIRAGCIANDAPAVKTRAAVSALQCLNANPEAFLAVPTVALPALVAKSPALPATVIFYLTTQNFYISNTCNLLIPQSTIIILPKARKSGFLQVFPTEQSPHRAGIVKLFIVLKSKG
jgi:hypothetical protein